MHIRFVEIQNFRKLESVRVDFTRETTVLVGPNNSGKTSAIVAMQHFLIAQGGFTPDDFTASNWARINKIGADWEANAALANPTVPSVADWDAVLPAMDLWLYVENDEIHHISHLLPPLDWEGGLLGVRLRLEPKDIDDLYAQYLSAVHKTKKMAGAATHSSDGQQHPLVLWPRDMREFLERRLSGLFTVRVYPLDAAKQNVPLNGVARLQSLPLGSEPIEGKSLQRLIRIDAITAHRELADANNANSAGDSRERRDPRRLSAQLKFYYDKHLDPQKAPEPSDLDALRAIHDAELLFDQKLRSGFSSALGELENLGYPGVTNPKLTIASKVRLTDGLNHDAAVQYDLNSGGDGQPSSAPLRLPENYNGLGYQNLISIAFKLMSFRDDWMQVGKAQQTALAGSENFFPPPLHLVLIEEPEAHLHAQVQQVFIRQAYKLLRAHSDLGENPKLTTQLVVSTHSSHIAHECEFASLRYFRRLPVTKPGTVPVATVVNLSEVFGGAVETHRFITRYLKATHCDLLFADAAIFVEGPAQRILLPQFLRAEFPELRHCYITILEIGGSHAHRLKPLIEHLGLTTLVITDLDAAESLAGAATPPSRGKDYVTGNTTMRKWLPRKESLDELLTLQNADKVKTYDQSFSVCVAYQCAMSVTLAEGLPPTEVIPYTFEDALVLENLPLFRVLEGGGMTKKFKAAVTDSTTPEALSQRLFDALDGAKKAEFALDMLDLPQERWPLRTPAYIRTGLEWLQTRLQQRMRDAVAQDGEMPAPPKAEAPTA